MSQDDLHAALEQLSQAHGTGELIAAMRIVQRTVRKARRIGTAAIGKFSAAVMEAIEFRDTLKAAGTAGPELDSGLEGVLRDTWPRGREEPWRDVCAECRDYGLVMHECPGDASCGRSKRHAPHAYGMPCWCHKGRAFNEKPKPDPSDFTDAGKAPKQKGFRRFGH